MKKRKLTINKGLTNITRGIIYLMGIAVLAVCAILLPELAREEAAGKATPPLVWPFLLSAWIFSIPIFVALYQALRLLTYIDDNTAFSSKSINALQNIKICAIIFAALIALRAITVINLAQIADPREDVTPVFTLGFIFIFTSSVIATFVAVLQKLLSKVIDIKSENDLIV